MRGTPALMSIGESRGGLVPRQLRALAQAARFIATLIATDYDRVLTRVEATLARLEPTLQELLDPSVAQNGVDGDVVAGVRRATPGATGSGD
jgi:hypothetical protein